MVYKGAVNDHVPVFGPGRRWREARSGNVYLGDPGGWAVSGPPSQRGSRTARAGSLLY